MLPDFGPSIFSEMTALAQRHGAINLAQGFPEFGPDPALLDAFYEALRTESAQYAPMPGLPSLREAIAVDQQRRLGLGYDPASEVTVVPGATLGIFTTLQGLVGAGDEVILLEPAYDSYRPAVLAAGAQPVGVALSASPNGFTVDWDRLDRAVNPKTKAIIVNTPHNPTGMLWTPEDWSQLSALLPERVLILSDEVYEAMVLDGGTLTSAHHLPQLRERSLRFISFGKTYHVTGWKLGAVLAPEALTRPLRNVYQFAAFSASTPTQHAVQRFLVAKPDYALRLPEFFARKRDVLAASLARTGFRSIPPQGSYFMLVDYTEVSTQSDRELAHQLTAEAGVATVPLSPFFMGTPPEARLLRLCFAKEDATLRDAGHRLAAWRPS
jgi:methionine aminotransferase